MEKAESRPKETRGGGWLVLNGTIRLGFNEKSRSELRGQVREIAV